MIHKSKIPEAAKRGRLFESAVTRLAEWWSGVFEVEPTGHIRSRTFEDVQEQLRTDGKGKGKAIDVDEDEGEGEVIRSEKSLMKHALMKRGSRDTSAQLFTALCRALGIPSRLVVSIQSVPWKASVGKPKASTKRKVKGKGKGKAKASTPSEDSDNEGGGSDMEEVVIPGTSTPSSLSKGKGKASPFSGGALVAERTPPSKEKGKGKAAPVIRLRGSGGRKSGSGSVEPSPQGTSKSSYDIFAASNRLLYL